MAACKSGHEPIVKALLDWGVNPRLHHQSWGGQTLDFKFLGAAVERGYFRIAKLLLERDTTDDKNTDYYSAPIVDVVRLEHDTLFRLLRDNGARVNAGPAARKALTIAIKNALSSMVKLLLTEGLRIAERDIDVAEKGGNVEVITMLKTQYKRQKRLKRRAEQGEDDKERRVRDRKI
jgi:hypothetical protein